MIYVTFCQNCLKEILVKESYKFENKRFCFECKIIIEDDLVMEAKRKELERFDKLVKSQLDKVDKHC